MYLYGLVLAVEGGTHADVHHAMFPFYTVFHSNLYSVCSCSRNQLTRVAHHDIGCRESQFCTDVLTMLHTAQYGIGISQ